ncbi:MAG: hypothetical protein AAGD01_03100 [Acidobacteriota bacterium]
MTHIAMLQPTSLAGQEIRELLEARRDLWQRLTLLALDEEEVGALTDVRGAAAMVQAYQPELLQDADVIFYCGSLETNRQALDSHPANAVGILVAPEATPEHGRPGIAALPLAPPAPGDILLSPHPAAVALGYLLTPLAFWGLKRATATVVQPASMHEQAGLDELFEQTRQVLTFADKKDTEIFGTQLAFNLLPAPATLPPLGPLLEDLLDPEVRVSTQLLQGGVFHSVSVSLLVELEAGAGGLPTPEELREALATAPGIDLAVDEELLGPIDAASREEVLVGAVRRDPTTEGGYWIWAVMDNLTRGTALNAMGLLEAALRPQHPS